MTPQRFSQLIVSSEVVTRIKGYRQRLPELKELKARQQALRDKRDALPRGAKEEREQLTEQLKQLQREAREITSLKGGLPLLLYQCSTFDETLSRKGRKGRWRKQLAARLNGLFMLDVDHVEEPRRLFASWWQPFMEELQQDGAFHQQGEAVARWAESLGVVLVHVTPSGQGLRLVAKASAERGNLADNQQWLATQLGVELDEACKDASRCSFCTMFDDILFMNQEQLFHYEDTEYNRKYGPLYREGHSEPTRAAGTDAAGTTHEAAAEGQGGNGAGEPTAERLERLIKEGYHGKSFEEIIEAWYRVSMQGSRPQPGDRHRCLLKMAGDLRYICDNDPKLLARVLLLSDTGKDIADERGEAEIESVADSACKRQLWTSIPKRCAAALEAAGVQLDEPAGVGSAATEAPIDYDAWYQRLKPLLAATPELESAVVTLPERHRLGGVLAAGAMMGTYLTRCWWHHFDGKAYRLSFLVYIIGDAASGKSFVTELDRLIMAPMLASDRVGREWERQYKEDMKKRSASTKNARQEAPDQQHPVIRYVPSTVSNAMLYRRLTDALDNDATGPDGEPMHLHVYTMEPELATALRAQTGSWAGKNDLELKSFHNEYAGVDYANDQSVNGIIQVNWNQVVTGTWESMGRKIRPSMVLDGLVTRLVLFPMPSNEYEMIERRKRVRDHERECLLRSVGITLDSFHGELQAPALVDYCYDYERELTREAGLEQDECLDYFRKRIPVIMMRYGLVRLVLRHKQLAREGKELPVDDSDRAFCRLIGDWCLSAQMRLYGQMVLDARQREKDNFVPRRRSHKMRDAYAALGEVFNEENLVQNGVSKDAKTANVVIQRWYADGLVQRDGKRWRKKYKEIPI